jgi:hypothetical protein
MTATQHPSEADDQASTPGPAPSLGTPAREPDGTGPQGWALNASLIADLTGRLDAGRKTAHMLHSSMSAGWPGVVVQCHGG